jgi:hypothetical protein
LAGSIYADHPIIATGETKQYPKKGAVGVVISVIEPPQGKK